MSLILIVEDDPNIAGLLQLTLSREGFHSSHISDGALAPNAILNGNFDLVLLDFNLPNLSGIDICKQVRLTSDIPIIFLSSRADIRDKVHALNLGANDYVTKPFNHDELIARINAALNHSHHKPVAVLSKGPLSIFPDQHRVNLNGINIELTLKEFKLLHFLIANSPNVLSRDQILQHVWGYDFFGDTNVVDVYISYLRSKLGHNLIHTIRGVGYSIP